MSFHFLFKTTRKVVILRGAKRSRRIHAAVDEDTPHGFRDFARNDGEYFCCLEMEMESIPAILAAMRTYLRNRTPGGLYFFTVNLAERRGNTLLIDKISHLREAFRRTFAAHPTVMDAVVVLPDHLHCIWQLPPGDDGYATRWRLIKSHFSRLLEPGERRSASRLRKGERGIWQRRYWEHTIRNERDYARHVDYIHYNPVKHGLVELVSQWPYSTFSRWVGQGVYDQAWAGDGLDDMELE